MHAMYFYTSTCRCVMQADPEYPTTLSELRRLLPCLRQALGCYVCFNLLKEPMGPDHNVCRHTVCINCLGGKMKLKPACSWCKDYWDFVPNPLMKVLVTCYKKLCIYIYNSPLGQAIKNETVNGEVNHLLKIITEGMNYDDGYITAQMCVSNDEVDERIQPSCSTETAGTSDKDTDEVDILTVHNEDNDQLSANVTPSRSQLSSNLTDNEDTSTFTELSVKNKTSTQKSGKKKRRSSTIDYSYQNYKKRMRNKKHKGFMNTTLHRKPMKTTHRLKSALSSSIKKKSNNKKRCKVKKFNTRLSKQDEPSELERIDNSDPPVKKVKVELPPPELKPLSLCNCGKSGNFNQLTCIGQRCPCYSMKLPCIGCKCRGCRNPKKGPDYQGMSTIGSSAVLRSGTRNTSEYMCVNS